MATKRQPWSIKRQHDGTFELRAPYSFAFKEDLKELVDPEYRNWLPEHKVWVIDEDCLQEVVDLCDKHFHTAVGPRIAPLIRQRLERQYGMR